MLTYCEALAKREGFYVVGSRAARNHNPGNINWGSFAMRHGATSIEKVPVDQATGKLIETPRFACFPTDQMGFNCMSSLLISHYMGMTVKAAIYRWAPPLDNNDSDGYVKFVCDETGLTPDTILTAGILAPPDLQQKPIQNVSVPTGV